MFQDARCTRLPQLITRNPTLDGIRLYRPIYPLHAKPSRFLLPTTHHFSSPSVHLSISRLKVLTPCCTTAATTTSFSRLRRSACLFLSKPTLIFPFLSSKPTSSGSLAFLYKQPLTARRHVLHHVFDRYVASFDY